MRGEQAYGGKKGLEQVMVSRRLRTTHFNCPKCGTTIYDLKESKYDEDLYVCEHIERELDIIMELKKELVMARAWETRWDKEKETRYNTNLIRRNFAIYRLFKTCDLTVNQIAQLTKYQIHTVGLLVGNCYKALCLSNDKCVLQPFLKAN